MLQPDVRRIADHEVRFGSSVIGEQEIAGRHPLVGQALGSADRLAEIQQLGHDRLARVLRVVRQQVEAPNCGAKVGERPAMPTTGIRQPFDDGQQEGSAAARGFHDDSVAKVGIGSVPDQVQDEVNHPSPSEHLTVLALRFRHPRRRRPHHARQPQLVTPHRRTPVVTAKLQPCSPMHRDATHPL